MGINYFMINGVSSLDFGIVISKGNVYNAPARKYEVVEVPGRNGSVIFDEGYYENVEVSYECQVLDKNHNLDGFRSWLQSNIGYVKIEDTYHHKEYRMGRVSEALTMDVERMKIGTFVVKFDCKPQRYLKDGEIGVDYTGNTIVFNPTYYESKPLIRVYGSGILGIGNDTITIASHSLPYIDIDCEIADAYYEDQNANSYITLTGDDYPTIGPGTTGITLGTGITQITLFPRWWTL